MKEWTKPVVEELDAKLTMSGDNPYVFEGDPTSLFYNAQGVAS